MAQLWRKPILLSGVGVSMGVWAWSSFHLTHLGEWGVGSALALGAVAWLLQPRSKTQNTPLSPLKREEILASVQELEVSLGKLAEQNRDIEGYSQILTALPAELARETLKIAITGRRKVGKTTLKELLNLESVEVEETLPLLGENTASITYPAAEIILFVVDGDLTASEEEILAAYHRQHYRILLILNKQDQYPEEEKLIVQQQLQERVKSYLKAEEVLSIAAAPNPIKVRSYQENGEVKEWLESANPEVGILKTQLEEIIKGEKEQLLLGSLWRATQKLEKALQGEWQEIHRAQALPIVEKYQWLSGATAFANPIAAVDLVATVAINAQMLVDLGEVYGQKFSLAQAQTLASTLGKIMLQLGLVEVTSNAIASLLKSHTLTYVAGGTVQGISAAYLTRIAGLSVMEYLEEQPNLTSWDGESLTKKIQEIYQQNQRLNLIQNFVKQTLSKNPVVLNF
jgi:uncharacterized protein (DUF697 family)